MGTGALCERRRGGWESEGSGGIQGGQPSEGLPGCQPVDSFTHKLPPKATAGERQGTTPPVIHMPTLLTVMMRDFSFIKKKKPSEQPLWDDGQPKRDNRPSCVDNGVNRVFLGIHYLWSVLASGTPDGSPLGDLGRLEAGGAGEAGFAGPAVDRVGELGGTCLAIGVEVVAERGAP